MDDMISRQAAIDALGEEPEVWSGKDEYAQGLNNQWHYDVNALKTVPSEQPESYKEKLKEIADALSEKFAYMNTCLNERDIILGYLGVKRPSKIHCNTDCTNIKCESHRCNKRLPSAQPEHECRTCRYNHLEWFEEPCDSCTGGGESNHWKPKEPEGDPCEGRKHIGKDIYEYPCDSCVHGGASCRWED